LDYFNLILHQIPSVRSHRRDEEKLMRDSSGMEWKLWKDKTQEELLERERDSLLATRTELESGSHLPSSFKYKFRLSLSRLTRLLSLSASFWSEKLNSDASSLDLNLM
jgi:hypothetical protein